MALHADIKIKGSLMKLISVMVLVCATALTACSQSGSSEANSEPASEAECRAMVEHGLELQGAPLEAVGELVDVSVQACVNSGKATKENYRCMMAATSPSETSACNLKF